jgi:hypothetical protein
MVKARTHSHHRSTARAPLWMFGFAAATVLGVSVPQALAQTGSAAGPQAVAGASAFKTAAPAAGIWAVNKSAVRPSDWAPPAGAPPFDTNPQGVARDVPRIGEVSRNAEGDFVIQSSRPEEMRGVIRIRRLGPNAPFENDALDASPGDDR